MVCWQEPAASGCCDGYGMSSPTGQCLSSGCLRMLMFMGHTHRVHVCELPTQAASATQAAAASAALPQPAGGLATRDWGQGHALLWCLTVWRCRCTLCVLRRQMSAEVCCVSNLHGTLCCGACGTADRQSQEGSGDNRLLAPALHLHALTPMCSRHITCSELGLLLTAASTGQVRGPG